MKSLSRVWLFATAWTVACQAPPSVEFSRQGYWSGLPFPSTGDVLDPRIEPRSPALQVDSTIWATREAKTSEGSRSVWHSPLIQLSLPGWSRSEWKSRCLKMPCWISYVCGAVGIHIVPILKLSFILHLSSCDMFCGYKSLLSFHSHSNTLSDKKQGGEQKCLECLDLLSGIYHSFPRNRPW